MQKVEKMDKKAIFWPMQLSLWPKTTPRYSFWVLEICMKVAFGVTFSQKDFCKNPSSQKKIMSQWWNIPCNWQLCKKNRFKTHFGYDFSPKTPQKCSVTLTRLGRNSRQKKSQKFFFCFFFLVFLFGFLFCIFFREFRGQILESEGSGGQSEPQRD